MRINQNKTYNILTRTELFALNFIIYKIMTGLKLYKDLLIILNNINIFGDQQKLEREQKQAVSRDNN
jgi:hypothetical protein